MLLITCGWGSNQQDKRTDRKIDGSPSQAKNSLLLLYMSIVAGGVLSKTRFPRPNAASGKTRTFSCSVREGKKIVASEDKSVGPPIVVTRGEPTEITVVNHLDAPTTIHWHGLELDAYYDGVIGGGDGNQITPAIQDSLPIPCPARAANMFGRASLDARLLVCHASDQSRFLDKFHGHVAQLVVNPAPSQYRPPIVKINLHGSPHSDPSGNCKALPHDSSPSAPRMT